jgi:iron complex outermembrane receptor protein
MKNLTTSFLAVGLLFANFPSSISAASPFAAANYCVAVAASVSGTITGADGEPLVNVAVSLKGTAVTTFSDLNGQFTIEAANGAVLVFKMAGFKSQEMVVDAIRNVKIVMFEQATLGAGKAVSVGSRDQTRKEIEDDATPFAVDIIAVKDVMNQSGHLELNQILQYAEPAFNASRQTGADLADHVDPASFRGLGTDQVLVLVNGKRYHTSANINVFGTRGRGNAGTDLNAIPASAVERIEILRDGAAAQYGSDAVAGVINIVLKENVKGTSGSITSGTNVTGWGSTLNYGNVGKIIPQTTDGLALNANATTGIKVGKGNITISADYLSKAQTLRPNNEKAFPDENYRAGAGNAAVTSFGAFLNGTIPTKNGELYFFGGYSQRKTDMSLWDISADDPTRSVPQIFSTTFTPNLLSNVQNYTASVGYKAKISNWNADFSATTGKNDMQISMSNTINPSLLQNSPTTFNNGGFSLAQTAVNVDIDRKFGNILGGMNIAFGGEYRQEVYGIVAGDEATWKKYPTTPFIVTNPDGTKDTLTKVGSSQGFPGFKPDQALSEVRNVAGGYLDAELRVNKNLLLTGALRLENYSDFGNAFGSKLAAMVRLSPEFYVRGSVQTGFRAPSLAQVYFRSTVNDVDKDGNNYEKIIFNSKSEFTKKEGIPSLTAEKSVNLSGGWVYRPNENLVFSVDAYQISVKDRIILTGAFFNDDDIVGEVLRSLDVKAAQFFTNALDTRSRGVDLNATYSQAIAKGKFMMTLAGNFNQMELTDVRTAVGLERKKNQYISPRELQFILSSAPQTKAHLTLNYSTKKWNFVLKNTYFSQMELIGLDGNLGFDTDLDALRNSNEAAWKEIVTDVYKARLVTDFSAGYHFTKKVGVTVGGNNIFDVYPTIQNSGTTDGGTMWDSAQMGMMGAFFYAKLGFKF